MTTYGYCRISTASQSIALQVDALRAHGVPQENIYADTGSGSKAAATRPQFIALLDQLEEGDELVVWRIDRLGRSVIDVLHTVANLSEERGVDIRSLSDGVDPSTTSGRLLLGILAALASYERELTLERIAAGIEAAKAAGVKFGRPGTDPAEIARRLRAVRALVEDGMTTKEAIKTIGWSKSDYYRHRSAESVA